MKKSKKKQLTDKQIPDELKKKKIWLLLMKSLI